MKIVVCDDSIEDLTEIERLLAKYKEIHPDIRIEVEQFSDAVQLYQKIQEKDLADIYILDMIMSEKTGIDIGTLIRTSNKESIIVYITSSDDFAMEAYSVRAVRYLLKPVSEEQFFEALTYAMSLTKLEKEITYPVKTKNGLIAVPAAKIEYIENYSRQLNIYLTNGENIKSIFIRKSFDEEIRDIAQDRRFIQVHKSFLINMNYVNKLTQSSILMESGKIIPVSKKRSADVRKEYLLYVNERYR